ncbi:hypothetical protein [Sulfuricaulis sp.]
MWPDEYVKRFWYRMGEIFGAAWYREYGPEATDLWRTSLSEISFERAALVVNHFRRSGDRYPPTMSQVMKVAREVREPSHPYKALPAPHQDAEKVASNIAQMRKKSRVKTVLLSGESFTDYQSALVSSGKSRCEFDAERLRMNGYES